MTTQNFGDVLIDRREHEHGIDTAVFSPDRAYRYVLTRAWGEGRHACWIMLNPSTADAFADDPTIRRCLSFTKALGGYGALTVVNLYALRTTDPRHLPTHPDPIGPLGGHYLYSQVHAAQDRHDDVIAARGTHGARHGRGTAVAQGMANVGVEMWCLGVTKGGHPKHPLYVAGDTAIVPFMQVGAS